MTPKRLKELWGENHLTKAWKSRAPRYVKDFTFTHNSKRVAFTHNSKRVASKKKCDITGPAIMQNENQADIYDSSSG